MLRSRNTQQRADTYYAWGVCGFLVVVIGLIYGQTLDHILLDYDDNAFIYENPHVSPGVTGEGVHWAFTEGPLGEWYPLAMLSHMLDCQLFGLEPWGHHLTSVLLHAAASIGLFLVLWRMTGELWPSAFVAAVFAVHPQHVESVAWVAERRDVLSGLFFMLTLGAYLGYVRHGRSLARYLLVAALFALGLMSKPMLVTLPPLLIPLDFWPLGRFGSASDIPGWTQSVERPGVARLALEKLPLFAIAAADCLMTLRTHSPAGVSLAWSERIGNAAVSCVTYVGQFFIPIDLAAFYPMPPGGPPTWKVASAIASLAVVSTAAVRWRRECPYVFVGWFWYLGMLSSVLGLVHVARHAMADRYMYLPAIGLYIALAWGATRLCAGSPERRRALVACAGLSIAALAACAARQTSFWRTDVTLWTHALACTTDNGKAELLLADALFHKQRFDEAVPHYHRAQKLAVDGIPFNNLGTLLCLEDKFDEAIDQFSQALIVDPNLIRAHSNLGGLLARRGRFDEAREHFRRAIELDPRIAKSHCDMAYLLLHEKDVDAARAEFEEAVRLDPGNAPAHNDLGSILVQQGHSEDAIRHFFTALAIDPKYVRARVNLARILAARGQASDAADQYRQALETDPNNPAARAELDRLLRGTAGPTP